MFILLRDRRSAVSEFIIFKKVVFVLSKKKTFDARTLAVCGMLCAMAFALVALSHFTMPAIIPAAPWLKYDPKDIILAIGGLLLGPVPAFSMSLIVSLLEMISFSETGWIGFVMNVVSSCAFILPGAIIYNRKRKLSSAVTGLVFGVVLVTVAMLLWNYLLTPIYMGMPREAVKDLLLPAFLPFNLIKGALNASFTFLIYKPLSKALKKARLLTSEENSHSSGKLYIPVVLLAIATIAACVVVLLILNGVI